MGCDLVLPDGSQSSGGSGMCPSRHDINKLISHAHAGMSHDQCGSHLCVSHAQCDSCLCMQGCVHTSTYLSLLYVVFYSLADVTQEDNTKKRH